MTRLYCHPQCRDPFFNECADCWKSGGNAALDPAAAVTALREKVEGRIPGFQKIVQDAKDSGDPDRIAEGAFLLGMLDEISDYVDALRELADV